MHLERKGLDMGYIMGTVVSGMGIALFRKGGTGYRIFGCIAVLLGVSFLGLSVMIDAKKNGVI